MQFFQHEQKTAAVGTARKVTAGLSPARWQHDKNLEAARSTSDYGVRRQSVIRLMVSSKTIHAIHSCSGTGTAWTLNNAERRIIHLESRALAHVVEHVYLF
jgi:hypothetical protein